MRGLEHALHSTVPWGSVSYVPLTLPAPFAVEIIRPEEKAIKMGASCTKTKSEALGPSRFRTLPPPLRRGGHSPTGKGPLLPFLPPPFSAPQGPFCDVSSLFILLYGCL